MKEFINIRRVLWEELSELDRKAFLDRPACFDKPGRVQTVSEILEGVRLRGDRALREYTKCLDGVDLEPFEVSVSEKAAARSNVNTEAREALLTAAHNIEAFHRALLSPQRIKFEVSPGVSLRRETRPLAAVGLYAPGGSASLPSTVLMLGIPASLAKCPVRILCTPPQRDGRANPYILEAASLCGIERIFKIGGAQAIAALAYGTESVPKVDKIFGPGNYWVTQAKEQVARDPSGALCDMPAGPSEVLVIADGGADAEFVAADLLSQAEHGADSHVVLISDSARLLDEVESQLEIQLVDLPRRAIAAASLKQARFIQVSSLLEALEVSNRYAPEHLILQVDKPDAWSDYIRNAGSVFLGPWTPESVGDYASGTNHVLPTYGYARVLSGLSVDSFQKHLTFQELTEKGLLSLGPVVETLASLEGLDAHRLAVTRRLRALQSGGRLERSIGAEGRP